jgi:hypothetical protein
MAGESQDYSCFWRQGGGPVLHTFLT